MRKTDEEAAVAAERAIREIYREVEGAAADEYAEWYEAVYPYVDAYEFYAEHRIHRGQPRECTGLVTPHGVVNTISPANEHAWRVRDGETVLPGIELWHDGTCRAYRHDFFLDVIVLDGGVEVDRVHLVLRSPELTGLVEALRGSRDAQGCA